MKEKYKKTNLEPIISECRNFTEVLRKLNMSIHGNSRKTLYKYVKLHNINTQHFETDAERYSRVNGELGVLKRIPLNEILVVDSTYNSTYALKNRLYSEGLKERKCELCGQDENWNNMKISLILDHINGVNNDNRIENLRIVCPNCNAGLPTHCGKNIKNEHYCSCGNPKSKNSDSCNKCYGILKRKIENRPPKKQLLKEIKELGYCGTGRKYGVSDNAIRKWLK